jgi:hypothetical protein
MNQPLPLLQRHLDDSLAHALQWLPLVLQDTQQALVAGNAPALRNAGKGQLAEVVGALQKLQPQLVRRTVDGLRARAAEAGGSAMAPKASGAFSLDALQLVDEHQAEQDIEVMRMVQLAELSAEWELRELQARTATLRGERDIRAEANPLRPEVVARAFWEATAELALAPEARMLLVRAAGEPMARGLREAYAQGLKRLESWGVQPAAYRAVQLPGRGMPPSAAPPNSGFDVTRPGALDELAGGRTRGEGAAGLPLSPEAAARLNAALDRVLAQLPAGGAGEANVIRAHQQALDAAARNDGDRHVVSLLAQLFESILHDATLLPAVHRRLARLQKPVLTIALRDARLLDDHSQPSWRLMNRIASHVMGYADPADPRLAPFLADLDQLLDPLAAARTPEAAQHAEALAQLEAIALKHLRLEQRAAGSSIEKLRAAERREELQATYREQLAAQMAGGPAPLDASLRRFLVETWSLVLAESSLRDGAAAPSTAQHAQTVDHLLRSLQPPRTAEDRSRLAAAVAPLVQRLKDGMALIRLPDAEREAVLQALMARHAELLKGDAPARTRDLTPEEIVQRMRDEMLDDVPSGSSVGGDSLLDVSALETVPAELMSDPTPAAARPGAWLDRVSTGTWCHLALQGGWTPLRLLWVSEARNHWLFSSAPGAMHSYTRRALERLASERLAVPLETRNLLERAVDAVLAADGRVSTPPQT